MSKLIPITFKTRSLQTTGHDHLLDRLDSSGSPTSHIAETSSSIPITPNEHSRRPATLTETFTHFSQLTAYLLFAVQRLGVIFRKYLTFIGPGFIIAVSYIDPGNYSTDVAAGALFEYKMLFVLLLSNAFAIFLQSLSCKLGCVTGYNLPELCRAQFPFWLNIVLYVFFEVAILATDLAEVIGTAIALNILFKIPLVAGVAITMIDVLIVLCAWKPDGTMRATRYFEIGVAVLVAMVVCCFIALLTKISNIHVRAVLTGYLPNSTAFSKSGIYTSLSIMGAVVMPHSLILGTGLTQPRMMAWDVQNGVCSKDLYEQDSSLCSKYIPSLGAVRHTLSYSIAELTLSLMTFALFVNSAILIVSGATLSGVTGAADADLFGIHNLLSTILSPAAGTLFAVALLASGQSAGIVTTMAGQLVSEGFFKWTIRPWLRRLITRSIAVLPCIVVAGLVGRSGLAQVLNASQVALSILLPFITFPIILFTSKKHVMKVATQSRPPSSSAHQNESTNPQDSTSDQFSHEEHETDEPAHFTDLSNSRVITILGWMIWTTIAGLNTYLIVILAQTHGTGT